MNIADLPQWVWHLVDNLESYQDEHPKLFRATPSGEYEPCACICGIVESTIPENVREAARVYRARRRAEAVSSGVTDSGAS